MQQAPVADAPVADEAPARPAPRQPSGLPTTGGPARRGTWTVADPQPPGAEDVAVAAAASAAPSPAEQRPRTPTGARTVRTPRSPHNDFSSPNRWIADSPLSAADEGFAVDDGSGKSPLPLRTDRPDPPRTGSLPIVALWTAASSLVPGTGLLTTRLRGLGWAMLAALILTVVGIAGWFIIGDPLMTLVTWLTKRSIIIGLMLVVAVVGIVWMLQVVLTNLSHATLQRLRGSRRTASFVIAAVMVLLVAVPFGRGVQSLWAAQGLLGSESVFASSSESNSVISDGDDPWAGVGRLNIMLLGQDAGEDRTGTRPDTIMVASIDTETGRTALFSIPRNLENVHFPEGTSAAEAFPDGFDYFGTNQNLINAVWTWANDRPDLFPGDDDPGLTATTWAVEETLGLDIDYYAMVNLQGFEDLVDAIGGVQIDVERRIPIGGGTNQSTGGKYPITGYIEPGLQTLDGYHALWYARSREGSDDFNRICRQQRMVRVVTQEADPATLALAFPQLVSATEANIESDIPVGDLDAFVELALKIKSAGYNSYPITEEVTPSYDADWDYLKKWVAASIDDSLENVQTASVVDGSETTASADPGDSGETTTDGADGTDGTDATTTEEPTDDPTEEATTEPSTGEESTAAEQEVVINDDPLQSCLPSSEQ
ncbi:LCP family glycopolymer transferase [Brachybacterium sp. DNPG3]